MNDTEYVVMKFGQTAQTVYMPRCYVDGNGKECINLKIAPDYETIFSNKSQTILIVLSYTEHMRAFDTILKRIYNDDDVGKLHCLQIDLSAWGDETCNITAEYLNNYSNDGSIDNLGLQKTFMNSHLLNDLKARLKQYNLTIKRIELEMPFFIDYKEFSKYNVVDDNVSIPAKMVRATIYITLDNAKGKSKNSILNSVLC